MKAGYLFGLASILMDFAPQEARAQMDTPCSYFGCDYVPPTAIEGTIHSVGDDRAPHLITIELAPEVGEAVMTVGPTITIGADCTPNPDCPYEAVGLVPPMTAVDFAPGYVIDVDLERYGWGWQMDFDGSEDRGSLLRIDPETGSACPVCSTPVPAGAWIQDLAVSLAPRTANFWCAVQPDGSCEDIPATFGTGTKWALDRFDGGWLRILIESTGEAWLMLWSWLSNYGTFGYAITGGPDGTIYLIYTYGVALPMPGTPVVLGYFDELNAPAEIVELQRADGGWFGFPSAVLFRGNGVDGSPELLIAVNRDEQDAAGFAVQVPPEIYRVPLVVSATGMWVPASPIVTYTYLVTAPDFPELAPEDIPLPQSLAQHEGSGTDGSSISWASSLVVEIREFVELIPCGEWPLPSCPDPFLVSTLAMAEESLARGAPRAASDHLVQALTHVRGCEVAGAPEPTDWIKDCPGEACTDLACDLQYSVAAKSGLALDELRKFASESHP